MDFLPSSEANQCDPYRSWWVTKVVEAFGDFWHSKMFTGKVPFSHEQELIEAYLEIGIDCLVIWESEVAKDPEEVRKRLAAYLQD